MSQSSLSLARAVQEWRAADAQRHDSDDQAAIADEADIAFEAALIGASEGGLSGRAIVYLGTCDCRFWPGSVVVQFDDGTPELLVRADGQILAWITPTV